MSFTCIAFWLALPLILVIAVALWATESRQQRAQRLRQQGWSQERIADPFGTSRSTVRRLLTA